MLASDEKQVPILFIFTPSYRQTARLQRVETLIELRMAKNEENLYSKDVIGFPSNICEECLIGNLVNLFAEAAQHGGSHR